LQTPPQRVRLWFSETINPLTSRAVVVDTTNREVDNHDSQVNASDQHELDLTLALLPAGTYVLVWRNQSAEDGHIVGGSFYFQVARPDGTVPPVPAVLPTGNIPGAGGNGTASGTSLDAPTSVQALFTWLALVFLGVWVGGLIWETWILTPGRSADSSLAAASQLAARRFCRLTRVALLLLLVSNLLIVLAQATELAGEWSGVFSLALLRAILFGSQFGTFWWLRQAVAVAALGLSLLASWRHWSSQQRLPARREALMANHAADEVRPWRPALLEALRHIPHLPRRLVTGWQERSWLGRSELLLGAVLIVAFSLSGHAAALPPSELLYGLSVDLLHLLGNAAWVGGLFYIAVMLLPSLKTLTPRQRAQVLAVGLPEFSALAIISASLLAATGSLNTAIRLTSLDQFLTTAYGRTLTVKISLFLLMVLISAFHAFVLRPRLVQALTEQPSRSGVTVEEAKEVAVGGGGMTRSEPPADVPSQQGNKRPGQWNGKEIAPHAERLVERLDGWLRREALLGCAVLLCVALLAAFSGSLATPSSAGTAPAGTSGGAYVKTQVAGGYSITLKVAPATFGTNTFTVTILTAQGQPLTNAQVLLTNTMVEMDMGVSYAQLKPSSALPPGSYSGQSDLTMGGHWNILVKILPPNASEYITTTFIIPVSY
jgi:putative copper export protein